jgi:hypothetical protein
MPDLGKLLRPDVSQKVVRPQEPRGRGQTLEWSVVGRIRLVLARLVVAAEEHPTYF